MALSEINQYPLTRFRDRLRVPPVLRPAAAADGSAASLRVRMVARQIRLHSELPASDVWTYAGHLPGPTIEVRRGHPLNVDWVNALPAYAPYPVTAVTAPDLPEGASPDLGQRSESTSASWPIRSGGRRGDDDETQAPTLNSASRSTRGNQRSQMK